MIVVKIGGSVRRLDPLLEDIATTTEQTVVVHGASRDLDDLSTRLGSPPRMVESERGDVSRFTDATTMDHFLMAYAGRANKRIVERLRQLGVNGFGLCGLDGGLVRGHDGRPCGFARTVGPRCSMTTTWEASTPSTRGCSAGCSRAASPR
jgi:acetylglutamate/LysW-gamma-L-alpha-aminoadipate kinase